MTLTLPPSLESALASRAERQGLTPAALAVQILSQHLCAAVLEPIDDWERTLLAIGTDCGISLSDSDISREAIYD